MISLALAVCAFLAESVAFGPPVGSAVEPVYAADAPRWTVTVTNDSIEVVNGQLDRSFTSGYTEYTRDGNIAHFSISESCCGFAFNADAARVDANELEVTSHTFDQAEHRRVDRYRVDPASPLVMRDDLVIVPYLFAARHVHEVRFLSLGFYANFSSGTVSLATVEPVTSSERPLNVPASTAVLAMRMNGRSQMLWYDPCSYRLYAYGDDAGNARVEQSLWPGAKSEKGIR